VWKPRNLEGSLGDVSTRDFRKPLSKPHFSPRYCKCFALLRKLKKSKLFSCLGSSYFREPPRKIARASVSENWF
jgi:hypothetical protein